MYAVLFHENEIKRIYDLSHVNITVPLLFPDFQTAWRGLANSDEQYVLRYESKYLTQVGSAMDYIVDMAVRSAATEALKYTVLSGR